MSTSQSMEAKELETDDDADEYHAEFGPKCEVETASNMFTDVSHLLKTGDPATKQSNEVNPLSFAAASGIASILETAGSARGHSAIPSIQTKAIDSLIDVSKSRQDNGARATPRSSIASRRSPEPTPRANGEWQDKDAQITALTEAFDTLQSQHNLAVEEINELRKDLKRSATRYI